MKRIRTSNNCRYALVYTKERVWELLSKDVVTTSQIAGLLGCDITTAYNKLNELYNEGKVTRSKAGSIWLWKRVINE